MGYPGGVFADKGVLWNLLMDPSRKIKVPLLVKVVPISLDGPMVKPGGVFVGKSDP